MRKDERGLPERAALAEGSLKEGDLREKIRERLDGMEPWPVKVTAQFVQVGQTIEWTQEIPQMSARAITVRAASTSRLICPVSSATEPKRCSARSRSRNWTRNSLP